IAEPAVLPRHGAGEDRAAAGGKAAADDEVVAGAEAPEEGDDGAEVVAGGGVAHEPVGRVRGLDAGEARGAVAALRDAHDPRAEPAADRNTPGIAVAASLIAVSVLARLVSLQGLHPLNWDELEYFRATEWVRHGLVPYRDFWEHHTPLQWFLFAPAAAL